ncbi:SAM-dependent methyltransferase [Sphingomonas alba]|uniref:Cyclopropane-fatty-acyl-phospholipid synthase family protein n=1 Tax=Sphingomonas alba TaxID=2908208 RepID=A0ABT0RPC9_9SPHN|nr:cyclopropane-fatty-acyl-phospholipid synthase family protein [Sphingomonas alba]MCL6684337.1 cyclopropane-fatty-acyl-phospholipid synthase family protein [Sphingomonas alba]
MSTRGEHLVRADRRFATGGLALLKPLAPAFRVVLDRIDAGLLTGGIDATLPDGSRRRLGFRTDGPVAIVRLNSWRAMLRLATSGSVGWYNAWLKGEWQSPDPVPLFDLFMRNGRSLGQIGRAKGLFKLANRAAHAVRKNTPLGARKNIQAHYDLGNDFYSAWLDKSMTYSSAAFEDGDSLEEAQARKIHLLLDRLQLKPGQRLLEIGCGWGSLAEIAARDYGVEVVGLTLSEEQKAYADKRMKKAGLTDKVEIRLADYRELDERFDAVASVEMVEAVGQEYWDDYLAAISRALPEGGRAALQLISIDPALFDAYAASPDFIQTYIFPGGMLVHEPRFAAIAGAHDLSWEGRIGYGQHYAETLKAWRQRFDAAARRGRLDDFAEEFRRLWRYYLMYCEGGFRGGGIDVAQVTMVKG